MIRWHFIVDHIVVFCVSNQANDGLGSLYCQRIKESEETP